MIVNRHDIEFAMLFLIFLQIESKSLAYPIELLHLQKRLRKLNLTEVIHIFLHKILVIRVDMWPQYSQNKISIIDAKYIENY